MLLLVLPAGGVCRRALCFSRIDWALLTSRRSYGRAPRPAHDGGGTVVVASPAEASMAARPGLEPGAPASEAGVVPVPPPRTDRFVVWTERLELPNPRHPTPVRSRCATSRCVSGTDGGSRTRTDGVLSAVPLPVGLRQRRVSVRGPCGIRTRNLLLAGELRFQLRHRPWWRGRGSNPPAGRMRPR
jgi:hypothetical protein